MLAPAAALGFFDGIVPVWSGSTLHQVRADRHVAATGSIEQPLMFEGNDLPGRDALLRRAAARLLYGVRPGDRAVVATTGDRGLEAALALPRPGSRSPAIADARPDGADEELVARLEAAGIPLLRGRAVVRALGRGEVQGAVVADLDEAGRWTADTERGIDCDLIAVSGGTVPATSLLLQAGAKARWDEARGAYLPDGAPAGIYAAGAVAGHGSTRARRALGRGRGRRGGALARARGRGGPRAARGRARERLADAAEPAVETVARGRVRRRARARQVLRLPLRGRDHRRTSASRSTRASTRWSC